MTKCITGDECGLLKLIDFDSESSNVTSYSHAQSRSQGIIGIEWMKRNQSFSVLRRDGQCELWSSMTSTLEPSGVLHGSSKSKIKKSTVLRQDSIINTGLRKPVGSVNISTNGSNTDGNNSSIACFGEDGDVVLINHRDHSTSLTSFACPSSSSSSSSSSASFGNLSAAASSGNGYLSLGGKENDLKMYDITTQQLSWSARNVPHDKLSLRVPVYITAITHLQSQDFSSTSNPLSSSSSSANSDGNPSHLIATGTGYRQVRLYDTRDPSRRPQISFEVSDEFRVTAIHSSAAGSGASTNYSLYVGDTAGYLGLWDLRTQRRLNVLGGFSGSIRNIDSNDNGEVAVVSIDRFLRIYDSNKNNKLKHTAYLKNRLTRCLLFQNEDDSKSMKKSKKTKLVEEDDDDDENDDNDDDDDDNDDDDDDDEDDELEDLEVSDDDDDDNEDDDDEDSYNRNHQNRNKNKNTMNNNKRKGGNSSFSASKSVGKRNRR